MYSIVIRVSTFDFILLMVMGVSMVFINTVDYSSSMNNIMIRILLNVYPSRAISPLDN